MVTDSLLGTIGYVLLIIFFIMFCVGFWRFTIISSYYLNEDGPVWFKPLLYGCLAVIPLLSAGSQCRDNNKNVVGCLPIELFGGRMVLIDWFSFTIMTIITIISALPFLFGGTHQPQS